MTNAFDMFILALGMFGGVACLFYAAWPDEYEIKDWKRRREAKKAKASK